MTNAEKRERRREAARKGLETRRARQAQALATTAQAPEADQADEFQQLADRINGYRPPEAPQPPRIETSDERARRAESAEEKRLANLRAVLRLALEIRREGDLYRHAAARRWPFTPKRWTPEQIAAARQFLETFRRPDGTYEPKPNRRHGKWRL
jgi:Rad3-related DNA helicase